MTPNSQVEQGVGTGGAEDPADGSRGTDVTDAAANEQSAGGMPTQDDLDVIRSMYAGFPKEEIFRLCRCASKLGLDAVMRQIYLISYNGADGKPKYSVVTSIDGYRTVATRSGEKAGQEIEEICDKEGTFIGVKFTVFRSPGPGRRDPYPAIAYLAEFMARGTDGKPTKFWERMPRLMTSKCAEALSHRMAFPVLAGTYTTEEIDCTLEAGKRPAGSENQGRNVRGVNGRNQDDGKPGAATAGRKCTWPSIAPEIARLSDAEARARFAALVRDREKEALQVLAALLPETGKLSDISILKMRVCISEPYLTRYRAKIDKLWGAPNTVQKMPEEKPDQGNDGTEAKAA